VLQVRSLALSNGSAPDELSARLEREIHSLDPDIPITDLQTMHRALSGVGGFLIFRLGARQAAGMGALGLILAVVGVYGVVSYGAAQRTREIGIRMAMGAKPIDILRLVLRQGVTLVAVGVLTGLALTLALARILKRVLLMASATDPLAFIGVTLLLTLVALGACYIPARRGMRIDPMNALRHE
jgi:ABC-type antimicrobial peptide transport system permease subunit